MEPREFPRGDEQRVIIGTILKAHGVAGFVKVLPQTDAPGRFRKGDTLTVRAAGKDERTVVIREVRRHGEALLLLFEGIASRSEAEALRGADVVVAMRDVAALPEGRYYIFQVIGMKVINERGEARGIIKEVYSRSDYDLYEVEWNGADYLIPAVREFIRDIDPGSREIHIIEREGLFE